MIIDALNAATFAIARAQTRADLEKALQNAVTALGFDSFNLSCGKSDKREFMLDPTVSSWTEADMKLYDQDRWAERDPLLAYAASGGEVCGWQVADWRTENEEEYARYLEYSGLKGGVTAPLASPSGALAAMTVLSASKNEFDSQTIRSIPLLGSIAMMRLEALGYDNSGLATPKAILAGLTDHQMEILRWAAKGKSNGDIGQIIGQKKRTVDYHMKTILKKLGVSTKVQAVAIYSCSFE
ncbi:LuxR family transcriptional regulator [Altererythrobacter sp. FM1]|uniref:Autoinducer binding domain-containing protein n=1 Tax=Tsuneonella flava TaxID=2055955 RepID=A0ABX7KET6_9SPHN|nr:LuxR family transcriptional regulator [Tsuneonella flava]QSB45881.1 autoinducer binding domain-containing protein [Tsuneonella flava]ROT93321.1 LuxR family transcriptional regulator [Altererythrobacter sp. FM1]